MVIGAFSAELIGYAWRVSHELRGLLCRRRPIGSVRGESVRTLISHGGDHAGLAAQLFHYVFMP